MSHPQEALLMPTTQITQHPSRKARHSARLPVKVRQQQLATHLSPSAYHTVNTASSRHYCWLWVLLFHLFYPVPSPAICYIDFYWQYWLCCDESSHNSFGSCVPATCVAEDERCQTTHILWGGGVVVGKLIFEKILTRKPFSVRI